MKGKLAVVLFNLVGCTFAARILALLPFAAKSHHIFFQEILRALALRGHNVVVYSPFFQETPIPNYVEHYVNTTFSENFVTYEVTTKLLKQSWISNMKNFWEKMDRFTEDTFLNENIQTLIRSDERFDLIITEPFFGMEALLGLGYRFNAPTIALQPLGCFGFVNRALGNSLSLAYIPDSSLPFSDKMTLFERIVNCFYILSSIVAFHSHHIPMQQQILDRHLKMQNAPSLRDMIWNVSLVLTNSHPTIHYPQPLTQNIIPLGGIHISKDKKPLPQHIQQFMDESKYGVIYFSLGTVVPDHQMPVTYFEHFTKVFQTLPQRVLWKTRAKNIPNLPTNVMVVTWAPQQDILAHPKCVLFMTHGGLLSLLETVHAGVPVVGIPFFNDQPMNVHYYEHKGIGVKLDFLDLSEETIFRAIQTVLKNPQYKTNAVQLSAVFRDLPASQTFSAVFWVEYVLRHGGAHHLRPSSSSLTWYQLTLLDVQVVIVVAIMVVVFAFLVVYRKIKSALQNPISRRFSSKKEK